MKGSSSTARMPLPVPMLTTSNMRRLLRATCLIGAIVAGWWFLAPTAIGGRTAMVVTTGNSMEPRLHAGDLAIVRKVDAGSLHAGDVALYRSASLHRHVLHRIRKVGSDGRMQFRGDANNFTDPERVDRSSVVGRMAFSIPGAGRIPGAASPALSGALAALLAFGAICLVLGRAAPSEPREHGSSRRSRPLPTRSIGMVVAAAGFIGSTLLWMHAGHLPTSANRATAPGTTGTATSLAHEGTFAYTGREPNTAIQPDHRVSTGDAVFTSSVRSLDVSFDYRLTGHGATKAGGTAIFDLTIEDDNGWHMTRHLDRTAIASGAAHLRARLDLAELRARVLAFERASRTTPPLYRLRLRPHVVLDEAAPGAAARTTFAPEVTLVLDEVRLRPETITGGDARAQYHPTETVGANSSGATSQVAATHRTITRRVGRGLAVAALLASLVITLLVWTIESPAGKRKPTDEPAAPEGATARELLDLAGIFHMPSIRVPTQPDQLVPIADTNELLARAHASFRPVLHSSRRGVDVWFVLNEGHWHAYVERHRVSSVERDATRAQAA